MVKIVVLRPNEIMRLFRLLAEYQNSKLTHTPRYNFVSFAPQFRIQNANTRTAKRGKLRIETIIEIFNQNERFVATNLFYTRAS